MKRFWHNRKITAFHCTHQLHISPFASSSAQHGEGLFMAGGVTCSAKPSLSLLAHIHTDTVLLFFPLQFSPLPQPLPSCETLPSFNYAVYAVSS